VNESNGSAPDTTIFSLSVSEAGSGRSVVAASGELDIASAPQLLGAVAVLAQPGTGAIAIDLSALTFIDSSGINALRAAVRSANAKGVGAIVAAPSQRVQRVFELVRLGDIIPLEHSLTAAFERLDEGSFSGPPAG
jgi:stage II sporulation protein AA (anti-sigma F factor antagonist)